MVYFFIGSLRQIEPLLASISDAVARRLALRAEVGAAVLNGNPLDGAAADRAGFVSFMSNLKVGMGCAQLALGTDIRIHAGAFAAVTQQPGNRSLTD